MVLMVVVIIGNGGEMCGQAGKIRIWAVSLFTRGCFCRGLYPLTGGRTETYFPRLLTSFPDQF